ncbi:MAG TPA: tellurite resistance/C4-dicarboxylate transporter family protein [Sphingomicrobium sp.]|jgi:tellurite resistance protein TehA-like permease|nr:tellurite resistance/C4-dicarboxylate transporter family protein [Sphingomicrobium sp.]
MTSQSLTADEQPLRSARQGLIAAAAETLYPGYFALVMATAAVSIAGFLLGQGLVAHALLGLNWMLYFSLCGLTLVRLVRFPRRMRDDLFDHQRAPGFFTLVAGTCMLATQTALVGGAVGVARGLWWLGLTMWFAIMYAFFTAVTVRQRKPTLAAGINGAWLIAAVATQSIVVSRGAVDGLAAPTEWIQFLCLAMFMIGCMLYLAIIPLIFYRLTFVRLASRDFSPPYWINMGAVAITTLAGSTLMLRIGHWPVLNQIAAFLPGFTLFFWAAATWWIPLLIVLMLWRYVIRREMPMYEPALWGMVFPLGMYTTATFQLSRAMDFGFLAVIPRVFIFVALAAWLAAFGGLIHSCGSAFRTEHK